MFAALAMEAKKSEMRCHISMLCHHHIEGCAAGDLQGG